jgi:hypothetical protein
VRLKTERVLIRGGSPLAVDQVFKSLWKGGQGSVWQKGLLITGEAFCETKFFKVITPKLTTWA